MDKLHSESCVQEDSQLKTSLPKKSDFSGIVIQKNTTTSRLFQTPGSNKRIYFRWAKTLVEFDGGLPSIDEATRFSQMIKLVQSIDFGMVLFDTVPTRHTLRLLKFPTVIEKGLGKLLALKSQFMSILSQFAPMLGLNDPSSLDSAAVGGHTASGLSDSEFKNPELTTFVCVCIAEFLLMYETERLVRELTKQIDELYEAFHITKLPLLDVGVRGSGMISDD